eukprot:scaffold6531_cov169-Ochromonas_danica.AAC.1
MGLFPTEKFRFLQIVCHGVASSHELITSTKSSHSVLPRLERASVTFDSGVYYMQVLYHGKVNLTESESKLT